MATVFKGPEEEATQQRLRKDMFKAEVVDTGPHSRRQKFQDYLNAHPSGALALYNYMESVQQQAIQANMQVGGRITDVDQAENRGMYALAETLKRMAESNPL